MTVFPSDFIYFYGIGTIAKGYPLTRLYDYALQMRTFSEIYPFPYHVGVYGPCPYPPFVALFFSLFARVPAVQAFFLWAFVSLVLYVSGIAAALKASFPADRLHVSLIFSLALIFWPFLHNTFGNGQISTIAVFSIGLAFMHERRSRQFTSGLALSILVYKPTLLLLLFPMLIVTRRFRTIGGFMSGATFLVFTATAFGGVEIWPAYMRFLRFFGRYVGFKEQSLHDLSLYVDFKSFIQAVCGGWSRAELVFFVLTIITMAILLTTTIWKSAKSEAEVQCLVWATMLTWTLLLNVYVPIYDSILFPVAAVMTVGALRSLEWKEAAGWMTFLTVLIVLASWELEKLSQVKGIQFLPILLAIYGSGQLYLLRRAVRQRLPREAHELPRAGGLSTVSSQ
ncbi:MAG: glycosyltransferase family 87 protein [Terracidiphilus sp.]